MPAEFAHLHLHTLYSLLDGAIRLPDLMRSCEETGMKAVAVTDHGNMFGVVNFYQEAKKHGIKPIIGFEAYVAGEKGMGDKTQRVGNHLVLLAQNNTGYRNLRYLSTKAFMEGFYYDPRVDKQILAKHSEGVIALTACMAGVGAEWREAVFNTSKIAEMCNVELELGKVQLPRFQPPEGESLESFLQRRAREGLDERFRELARAGRTFDPDTYRERLERELGV